MVFIISSSKGQILSSLWLILSFLSCLQKNNFNHWLYITFSTYERTMFSISSTMVSGCPSAKPKRYHCKVKPNIHACSKLRDFFVDNERLNDYYLQRPLSTQGDLWGLSWQLPYEMTQYLHTHNQKKEFMKEKEMKKKLMLYQPLGEYMLNWIGILEIFFDFPVIRSVSSSISLLTEAAKWEHMLKICLGSSNMIARLNF